jgi:DNA-binding Lrp family transcriptional regulator
MHNMKAVELRLVAELMKNSRRSDRELAKIIGVSQPTVTRTRIKLEKEGLIEYTAVPNFAKLGFEMLAFTLSKRDVRKHLSNPERAKKFAEGKPQIIFGAGGLGAGFDRIAVSVHKNYTEYSKFMQEDRTLWADFMSISNFVIDLKNEGIVHPLSFKHLADYLLTEAMSTNASEKTPKSLTCPKCGKRLPQGKYGFCPFCGASLEQKQN